MRTAEQVVNEIHSSLGDGDKQGLRNTAALLEALQAWPECPVIHIAGTNGKGSVCAMLSSILTAAGYRTGLYTSPFLQTYRERIRINGIPVSEEKLAAYGNETLDAARTMKQDRGYRCTPFELGTALAFHTFKAEKTDLIVAETGMGGRLDPTNAIEKPAVCGITAIGMDHMQYLGNTIEEIAGEKAGIIKPGVPVVCYPQDDHSTVCVIEKAAKTKGAPMILMKPDQVYVIAADSYGSTANFTNSSREWKELHISLPGDHQVMNALVVLGIIEILERQGICMPDKAVRTGLADTFWPGRLEWNGNVLLDGAHNEQGVTAFRRFSEKYLKDRKKVLLCGVLREKLTEGMLLQLSSITGDAVTVTPDSPRALKAEELSRMLAHKGMRTRAANTLKEGLETAKELAGEDGIVLATGSLYFIGALRNILGLQP